MSAKRENFVPDTVYARIMDGKGDMRAQF